jgi:hypothetical protein
MLCWVASLAVAKDCAHAIAQSRPSGYAVRAIALIISAASRRAIALATIQHSAGAGASLRFATPAAVPPGAADDCIAPAER